MPSVENTLVFGSILFLIVFDLSGRYREEDLHRLSQVHEGRLLQCLPNIGVFSIVHTINSALLMLGYQVVFVTYLSGDDVSIFLILLTNIALLIVLPYLEIDGYEEHLSKTTPRTLFGRKVTSLRAHLFFGLLAVVFPMGLYLSAIVPHAFVSEPLGLLALYLFTVGVIFGPIVFLNLLKEEFRGLD